MTDRKLISKDKYMEILKQQLASLASKAAAASEDHATLDYAIEDLKKVDFDQVEVIQDGDSFTFQIVEKNND